MVFRFALVARMAILAFAAQLPAQAAFAQEAGPQVSGMPSQYPQIQMDAARHWLFSDQYLRTENQKYVLLWPVDTFDRNKPKCNRNVQGIGIFVKTQPTRHYTRESLWAEFRPVMLEAFRSRCGELSAYNRAPGVNRELPVQVAGSLYFGRLFVRDNKAYLGEPEPNDLLPRVAEMSFIYGDARTYSDMPFPNAVPELFGPKIFGFHGRKVLRDLDGRFFTATPEYVDPVSGKNGVTFLKEAYADFPNFEFLDALAVALDARDVYERNRAAQAQVRADEERSREAFWVAVIIAAILAPRTGDSSYGGGDAGTCLDGDMYDCGRDIPLLFMD